MLYGATGSSNSARSEAVNCSAQAQGLQGVAAQAAAQQSQANDVEKVLTKRGRATYELKTNTLIITDTARKIQEIRELLARLDVPARQVMIEARVVVADSNWSRDLGVRLNFAAQNSAGNRTFSGNGQALPGATGTLPGLLMNLIDPTNQNMLGLELQALEADNRGKVVSNPRVMTSNQKPAVILNGTQIPYITPGTLSSPATVTFKDVFLCLLVDPQILNNDSLIMTVEVQKDATDASNTVNVAGVGPVPAITTKRVKTQVRVNNGETLVIGGIFDQQETNNVSKVPLLGDLPVLGNLFKTTSKSDGKTELLIFLTPRILDDRLSLR